MDDMEKMFADKVRQLKAEWENYQRRQDALRQLKRGLDEQSKVLHPDPEEVSLEELRLAIKVLIKFYRETNE